MDLSKKILICADYPFPDRPVTGGIPRAVFSTVQAMKKLRPDSEFHVCTLNDDIQKSKVTEDDNLFVHYIHFPLKNVPILFPKQLTSAIIQKNIRKIQPDLVHAHGTGKDYAYPAISWNPGSTIITVHGVIQQESKHWTGLKGRYHAITGCRIERSVLEKARTIIAVSPYVKRCIQPQTRANISVIINPVEEKFFKIKKEEVTNRLLFVGGIEERKGLDTLIRALAQIKKSLPDIELHIVGGIRKIVYYHTLINLVRALNLEKNVVFSGRLKDKDLQKEYAEAALFVLPSLEESQGIVILEAMATGTPLVATRAGGIPDMIQDNVNGCLVDCGNDRQLSGCIESLLQEHERRQRIAMTGKEMASNYLPEPIARQHLQVYDTILLHQARTG